MTQQDNKLEVTVADGKYTVRYDNGKMSALRYGKPWREDISGDNLIYRMMVRINELEGKVESLEGCLERLENLNWEAVVNRD